MAPLDVSALLAAYELGAWGRLSDGPVASGRTGSIWRLDTAHGSWAVKEVPGGTSDAEVDALLEGAAFQAAAVAAGLPAPLVLLSRSGAVIADVDGLRVRLLSWVDLRGPDILLDPREVGHLVAGLHRVAFAGSSPVDAWYSDPVGEPRWRELTGSLRARRAPFVEELEALLPELIALEAYLGGRPRSLQTCHRDLWADNLRRTVAGGLCVFDFDEAGLADPSQELALVLVEYADGDPVRSTTIRAAYADAGGPGHVASPTDFAMPIAQLGHIIEEGCRRWLVATTDAGRADNEGWVRECIDRPLTRPVIDALLS